MSIKNQGQSSCIVRQAEVNTTKSVKGKNKTKPNPCCHNISIFPQNKTICIHIDLHYIYLQCK